MWDPKPNCKTKACKNSYSFKIIRDKLEIKPIFRRMVIVLIVNTEKYTYQ